MPLPRTLYMIVNPVSGRGKARAHAAAFAREAERLGCRVPVVETVSAGDARRLARECPSGTDVIVAVGGDGTLNEVLNGLAEGDRAVPVALFPQGTANVIARELGLPRRAEALAEVAVRGRALPVDVGDVNGRTFSLAVGVGFDAEVVRAVHARRQGAISYASYFLPLLRAFWRFPQSPALTVTVDGERVCDDARYCVVCNTARYGGPFIVTPEASMEDGKLDVWMLRSGRRRDLVAVLVGALLGGRHVHHRASAYLRAQQVEVCVTDPSRAAASQVDGDIGPELPLLCTVCPRSVRVMIPAPEAPA